ADPGRAAAAGAARGPDRLPAPGAGQELQRWAAIPRPRGLDSPEAGRRRRRGVCGRLKERRGGVPSCRVAPRPHLAAPPAPGLCDAGPMSQNEQAGEPITQAGIEDLKAELAQLEGPKRQEIVARIKAARELGDLKENADYHTAKEDQAHLETRIQRLQERLRNAVVVEVDQNSIAFAFGRTAEVLDEESGETKAWTLVGSTEANLAEGRLSAES